MSPKFVSGMSKIFAPYDCFILDLWGVIHDGVSPLPGAIPTLEMLKKAKRKVWLLSNAPRRSHTVIKKLTDMGVSPDLYEGILTSGEQSWVLLKDTYLKKWGRRCFHLGPYNKDDSLFADLEIKLVDEPSDANFILNTGPKDFLDTAEMYQLALEECVRYNLPMMCANPDKLVHVQDQIVVCAGTLADMYEKMKGEVLSVGKPHRNVYSQVLKEMGEGRTLMVGDSMVTDIKGATGAGIDSALVMSGLHREEFLMSGETEAQNMEFDGFLAAYPYKPTYFMKNFTWDA